MTTALVFFSLAYLKLFQNKNYEVYNYTILVQKVFESYINRICLLFLSFLDCVQNPNDYFILIDVFQTFPVLAIVNVMMRFWNN